MSENQPWTTAKIADLGRSGDVVQTGPFGAQLHAEDYTKEGIPLILIRNITESGLDESNIPKISTADAERLSRYSLIPGDIVFSRVGRVGSCFLAEDKHRGWIISGQTLRTRTDPCKVYPGFLFYALQQESVREYISGASVGTTRTSINTSILENIEIPLPPLPEQKKIAEILSGIDKIIANLDLQKTKYEQLFASMLSKVFTELQETNRVCRIGDICEVKRGASPRPIQSKEWWGQGRGWTRISDVTKSKKYLYATKDRLSSAGEQKSVPIDPGSIVLSICATIGLPVIPKIPVCIHDGFVWFDGIEKELLPEFAYYFFLSIREGLLSGRQTGTQGNLNTSIVSQQLIPVPTQDEQRRIIKILSEMEFQGEKIDRKIQSHRHLKSSISADLLSGRMRVSV